MFKAKSAILITAAILQTILVQGTNYYLKLVLLGMTHVTTIEKSQSIIQVIALLKILERVHCVLFNNHVYAF